MRSGKLLIHRNVVHTLTLHWPWPSWTIRAADIGNAAEVRGVGPIRPSTLCANIRSAEPCKPPEQETKPEPALGTTHRNLLLHNRLYWVDTQPVSSDSRCYSKDLHYKHFSNTDAHRSDTTTSHTIYSNYDNK